MSEQEDRVFETETQPESTPQPESKPKRRFKRKKSKHSDLWMVLNTAVVVVVLCNAKEFFRKPVLWVLFLIGFLLTFWVSESEKMKGWCKALIRGAAVLAIAVLFFLHPQWNLHLDADKAKYYKVYLMRYCNSFRVPDIFPDELPENYTDFSLELISGDDGQDEGACLSFCADTEYLEQYAKEHHGDEAIEYRFNPDDPHGEKTTDDSDDYSRYGDGYVPRDLEPLPYYFLYDELKSFEHCTAYDLEVANRHKMIESSDIGGTPTVTTEKLHPQAWYINYEENKIFIIYQTETRTHTVYTFSM